MTIYYINTGTSPNKGDGDTLRTAFNKINLNFQSLESLAASGVAVQTTAPTNPVTGQLWWNPNTDILAIYSNGGWIDTGHGGTASVATATQTTLGVVKGSSNILVKPDGSIENNVRPFASTGISIVTTAPDINGYRNRTWGLLPATTSTIGGVKESGTIVVAPDGTMNTAINNSATNGLSFITGSPDITGFRTRTWSLVPATTSTLGGVKYTQAGAITVNGDGTLNFTVMFDNGTGTQANMIWPNDGITPPSVTYDVLPATGGTLGGVKIGAGVNVDVDGTISVTTGAFALQTATNTILGGVKIGGGFSISPDGTISAQSPLVPIADTPPGGASDGELWWSSNATNLYIRYNGAWIDASPSSGGGGTYTLTTATNSALGGVKIGTGINIDGNGVISVTTASFALQTASDTILGGVKVGSGLSIDGSGVLSAIGTTGTQAVFIADYPPYPASEGELWWDSNSNNLLVRWNGAWFDATPATPPPSPYSLPTATQSVLGGVKIDNITITIDGDGIISATGGGGGSTTWGLLLNKNNNNGPAEIALGQNAGSGQGSLAIAIGGTAGGVAQGTSAISIGSQAGASNQSRYAVAIGTAAGGVNQGEMATAVGHQAGASSQGVRATAIGIDAGFGSQGAGAVAIGDNAGGTSQGDYSVAIGTLAGSQNQGPNSIAIGNQAGHHSQAANSIVLNAGGFDLEGTNSGLYISPIRPDASTTATTWGLFYNPSTGEITTSTAATGGGGGGTYTLPVASTGTLGGVKIGEGIQQRIGGQIYIPTANTSTAGIVKLGNGFFESPAGTINVDIGAAIPQATTATLGTIRLGAGLFVSTITNQTDLVIKNTATDGIYFTTNQFADDSGQKTRFWHLKLASTTTFGGIVVGENLTMSTATSKLSVPYASTTTAGVVKVYPGGPFVVEPDGMLDLAITFENGTGTQARVVWPDNGVTPPALHYDILVGPALLINPNGAIDTVFLNTTTSGLSFINSAPDGNGYRTRTWSLDTATTSTIGGVKVDGTTINIDGNGVISSVGGGATFTVTNVSYFTNDVGYLTSSTLNQYVNAIIIQSDTAPASTTSTFWYDTVSGRTYTYFDGSWVDTNPNIAILPTASTSTLGVVKIGDGISIDNSGTISVSALPAVFELTSSTAVVSLSSDGKLTLPNGIEFGLPWGAGYPAITSPEVTDFIIRTSNTTTSNSWGFQADGVTRFPSDLVFSGDNGTNAIIGNEGESSFTLKLTTQNGIAKINLPSWNDMYSSGVQGIDVVVADNTWTFRQDSILQLPAGGDIVDSNNVSVLGGGSGATTWADITDINNGNGPEQIAIGTQAGANTQGSTAVSIGAYAGQNTQGGGAVAVGNAAGQNTQQTDAIAIGTNAGNTNQGAFAIAIGTNAGITDQPQQSIVINATAANLSGTETGFYVAPIRNDVTATNNTLYYNTSTNELTYGPASTASTYTLVAATTATLGGVKIDGTTIHIDVNGVISATASGSSSTWAALGGKVGLTGPTEIALGYTAGFAQGSNSIALGNGAGQGTQGAESVAIGHMAAQNGQGANAIAIGSYAGQTSQPANSIVINASGSAINGSASGFFVAPVREDTFIDNIAYYNTVTNEVTYAPNIITTPHQLSSGTVSVTVLGTATNYFSQGHAHNLGEVDMTTGTYIVFDSTLNQDNWSGAIGDGVSTSSLGLFTRVGPIELIAGAYSNRWDFNTDGTLTLPSGGTISYTPAVAGNWAGAAPTTIQQAIDRLAAAVKALNGTGA